MKTDASERVPGEPAVEPASERVPSEPAVEPASERVQSEPASERVPVEPEVEPAGERVPGEPAVEPASERVQSEPAGERVPVEPASERVRRTWVQRAAAEYTSAALTQQLGHWLTLIGAPVELVLASLDIVRDELDHAGLCHDVAAQAGATSGPVLAQDRMQHAHGSEGALAADLLRALIRSFCVGETLAVPLFRAMREGCSVPAARAVLDRILVDEVRHREFAWIALEWLLAAPASAGLLSLAAASAAEAVGGRISRCSEPLEQVLADLPTGAERAWGLIGQARYRELVLEAIERELRPRFARLGVALPASF